MYMMSKYSMIIGEVGAEATKNELGVPDNERESMVKGQGMG